MGHSSARAALIYQHATQERDEGIAAGLGKLLRRRKAKADGGAGTELPPVLVRPAVGRAVG